MIAFLYARVSTDDKGQDPENQLPAMRDFALSHGWRIAKEYVDFVSAGGKKVREQFDEMMAAAVQHKADVIILWALDRFSREGPLRTMILLDRLNSARVRVTSLKEPWLDPDSPTYDLLLPIIAWIAKQERIRMSERVKAGMARARAQGKRMGRPGHDADVAQVQLLRARGWSLRAIATHTKVSEATVRRVLESPAIVRQKGVKK